MACKACEDAAKVCERTAEYWRGEPYSDFVDWPKAKFEMCRSVAAGNANSILSACTHGASETSVECAWLVEFPDGKWWNGLGHYVRNKTSDANESPRFAREADAQRVCEMMRPVLGETRATEHVWLDAARERVR